MPFKSKAQEHILRNKKTELAEKSPIKAPKKLADRAKDKNHLKEYSKKHRRSKNG